MKIDDPDLNSLSCIALLPHELSINRIDRQV